MFYVRNLVLARLCSRDHEGQAIQLVSGFLVCIRFVILFRSTFELFKLYFLTYFIS